jgi:polyisoprenoid-binding protein YceI
MKRRTALIALLLTPLAAGLCFAHPVLDALGGNTYGFGTHKARTTMTFVSEADIETIHGVSHEMAGRIAVAKDGRSAGGKLQVPVAAMRTGIDLRDEHLRSSQWLDAKKYPYITLELTSARPKAEGAAWDGRTWAYEGRLTIKGATRALSGEVDVSVVPERLNNLLGPGKWIRVRTHFDVKLKDFGIEIPQNVVAKVSEVWKVRVDVYGTTEPPTAKGG